MEYIFNTQFPRKQDTSRLLLDEMLTPPPVAKPTIPAKKAQLAAAKRLEKDIRGQRDAAALNSETPEVEKASIPKNGKKRPADCLDTKGGTKKSKKDKNKKAREREADKGPLAVAYQSFMESAKSKGASHKEAMAMWRNSDERERIVMQLSPSERKRRRY